MRPRQGAVGQVGATTTELAVLMPVLIMMLLAPVQVGLWWHARQVADAAAEEAVDVVQVQDSNEAQATAAAFGLLNQVGNLRGASVVVQRGPEEVVVEVRGRAPQVVPGIAWGVTSRAAGPMERLVPENERR